MISNEAKKIDTIRHDTPFAHLLVCRTAMSSAFDITLLVEDGHIQLSVTED